MKILVVNDHEFPHVVTGQIYGGANAAELNQINLLKDQHEVTVFCTADNTYQYDPKVIKHMSTVPSWLALKENYGRIHTKTRISEILALINSNDFDCVFCHDWTVSTQKAIAKSKAKGIVLWCHVNPNNLGGISSYGRLDSFYEIWNNGSIIVFPSKSCVEQHRKNLQRMTDKYAKNFKYGKELNDNVNEIIKHHIYPFTLNTQPFKINEDEGYVIYIGRLDANKNVPKAINLAKNNGWNMKILAPIIQGDVHYKNYQHFLKYYPVDNMLVSLPRTEIFEHLSRANTIIISRYDESFSIVAAEAWCSGVPIIASDNKSGIIPAALEASDHLHNRRYFSVKTQFELPKLTLEERKAEAERARLYYSNEKALEHTMGIIQSAIDHKKSKVRTLF